MAAKNIVLLSVDSVRTIKEVPVLRVKASLPEIVVDGYRIRKNTKNLHIVIDLSKESEFKVFSDYAELEDHIDLLDISDIRKYRIYKTLSIPSEIIISVLNGLIIKKLANYILEIFSDYDGFNINTNPTEPGTISISREEDLYKQGEVLTEYSDRVLKYICKSLEEKRHNDN